jgi:hypothetical protein
VSLASERVATVLERLHAKARIEDPQAKRRVHEREAELGARLAPPERRALRRRTAGDDARGVRAYQQHVHRPGRGHHSITLPLDAGIELTVPTR